MTSKFVQALENFGKAIEAGLAASLGATGVQAATKTELQNNLTQARQALTDAAVTTTVAAVETAPAAVSAAIAAPTAPVAAATEVVAPLVQDVEPVVGQAVEQVADAEIAAYTGPFAAIAEEAANTLLNAVGGKIEDAIAKLTEVHQGSTVTTG